ncbi:hypothetical protein FGB62_14g031 [Gracilaria domingensis]|nr:hypothetical protein FGB62_14g031 [Gracilaria domingensis]
MRRRRRRWCGRGGISGGDGRKGRRGGWGVFRGGIRSGVVILAQVRILRGDEEIGVDGGRGASAHATLPRDVDLEVDNGAREGLGEGDERAVGEAARQGDLDLLELGADVGEELEERHDLDVGQLAVRGDIDVSERGARAEGGPAQQREALGGRVVERERGEVGEVGAAEGGADGGEAPVVERDGGGGVVVAALRAGREAQHVREQVLRQGVERQRRRHGGGGLGRGRARAGAGGG